MKTLLVNKMGMVFRTRAANRSGSSTGEVGETEGVIRHLVARGDVNIVYFGQCRGELPCEIIESCTPSDLNEWSTAAYQEKCMAVDVDALKNCGEIIGMIQMAGYAPTFSHIDNPNGATVQAAAVRYSAPALNVIEKFKLPRCIINNDPRTYPRDQEMSKGWPHCRPVALLDQCHRTVPMVVGGKKYRRVSCYGRCESFAYLERFENTGEEDCVVVAHAHIGDGCKQTGRDASWVNVLHGTDYKVYGKGWEYYSEYSSAHMLGVINPSQVPQILSRAIASPCVAQESFYTGKPYVLWASGCVPILYGDGNDPYTWDPDEQFLPLNHHWRIKKPGDLHKQIDRIKENPKEFKLFWDLQLMPRWEVLDKLVDSLLAGKDLTEFGGYL